MTIYTNAFLFALFVVGDENMDNSINETKVNKVKPQFKESFYSKQFRTKQNNSQMRSHHRISQPQWRGHSH